MKNKITNKEAKVLIIGGGYVGLPLAVLTAEAGFDTLIYDYDENKINDINNGKSYIQDISDEKIIELAGNKLNITNKFVKVNKFDADIILICVPTPLNKMKDPDISYVLDSAATINRLKSKKTKIVVLESTVYPGFTEEVLKDAIGEYCYLGFSPERVDPGNQKFTTKNTPKVVGAINEESLDLIVEFYEKFIDTVVPVSTCGAAEMTKILENSFRMVNIGFINEMALACQKMDIDVWEVIEAANTKPFGFMKFTPGAGLGGHSSTYDEWGTFKLNGKIINEQIGKLFELVSEKDRLEVISYDEDHKKFEWKQISAFTKHKFKGEVCTVLTEHGYSVKVTDRHPMLIYNEITNSLEEKFACELTEKDFLPTFDSFDKNYIIKCVNSVKKELYNDYVYSIEVPDNHNLVLGNGILIHNCIPLDPHYLTWKLRNLDFDSKMINTASEINSNMPKEVVRMVFESLNELEKSIKNSKILVIGVAYKPDIDDVRESPALDIIEELYKKGATISYYDPYVEKVRFSFGELYSPRQLTKYDCGVIVTPHSNVDYTTLIEHLDSIVDTRNILKNVEIPEKTIKIVL